MHTTLKHSFQHSFSKLNTCREPSREAVAFCISDIPSLFDGWARIRHAIRVYHKEISENQGNDVVTNVASNVVTNVASNEDKVIALLRQDGKMTAKVLAASLGLTQRQVQRILANLKERNKIIRHGASKNGYWEVTD